MRGSLICIVVIWLATIAIPLGILRYYLVQAGRPNGFPEVNGELRGSRVIDETAWRETRRSADLGIWNERKDECRLTVRIWMEEPSRTRAELIESGLLAADNPIRPLTTAESAVMRDDIARNKAWNTALGEGFLMAIISVLFALPSIVALLLIGVAAVVQRRWSDGAAAVGLIALIVATFRYL